MVLRESLMAIRHLKMDNGWIWKVVNYIEFKAVMVLREITRNYGNYRYGNYVGNAPRR